MNLLTHEKIDRELCGQPQVLEEGHSKVSLLTTQRMSADDTGLVHGGFIFGLADFAAMIAVNHPTVVLGAAEVRFLKPVKVGDTIDAEARVTSQKGKKHLVQVTVNNGSQQVFEGSFTAFVTDQHVFC